MKKKRFSAIIPCLVVVLIFFGCAAGKHKADVTQVPADTEEKVKAQVKDHTGGYLEGLTFERISGKERICLLLSKASGFDVARESGNSVIIKLADTFVSEKMRERQGQGLLENVHYVLPMQKIIDGKKWGYVQIYLGKMVPYRIREDISGYIIDFDVSTLPVRETQADLPEKAARIGTKAVGTEKPASSMKTFEMMMKEEALSKDTVPPKDADTAQAGTAQAYTGRKITLDLQDANIKGVFRLLTEISGINIVSGPDVKGTVTVYMKDVPWDQAFDTILDTNGLAKKELGSVISVMTLAKKQKDESTRQAAESALVAAEKIRKARELKLNAEQGKLRQISIEAKIVEVSTNFSRELGVIWGGGFKGSWGSRDFGMAVGNTASGSNTAVTAVPGTGIGLTGSNIAVNFPSAAAASAPALGFVLGTASTILDAKLAALETTGEGKIISSPKVTTLDGEKATITQGEEIPYRSGGDAPMEFKDAVLSLEVTPLITPEGKISMEVTASNNYADWNKTNVSNENPPIVKSMVDSKVLVRDGDTLVVGGIYKTNESETMSGVPWLSKIPVLGWLFKYKTTTTTKRELLVFITPRIVPE